MMLTVADMSLDNDTSLTTCQEVYLKERPKKRSVDFLDVNFRLRSRRRSIKMCNDGYFYIQGKSSEGNVRQ